MSCVFVRKRERERGAVSSQARSCHAVSYFIFCQMIIIMLYNCHSFNVNIIVTQKYNKDDYIIITVTPLAKLSRDEDYYIWRCWMCHGLSPLNLIAHHHMWLLAMSLICALLKRMMVWRRW